ncbi:transglutaminase-like domain-containing protein [Cellulomonas aerilata]|uniref:Transglutaminase-like domain-containing protein n=1 Tax=Cellulomonas aerilata TaxID=515326 RepID=A0A512D8R0_9CELL|nr:transglutaminase-like domain-containing protein [Cellulomonas aerilata]GEO32841.1 hypothetical protein CAE01nite_05660 [Cellulomonas aerilata]
MSRLTAPTGAGTAVRRRPRGRTPAPDDAGRRRPVVDVTVLLLTLVLAVLPVLPVFGGPGSRVVPALAGGLVLGVVVAAVAAHRAWSAVGTAATAVLVWLLAGGPLAAPGTTVAGAAPTLTTVTTLLRGAVTSWKEVLTLEPPLAVTGTALVAPYALAFTGAVTATSVALRARSGRVASAAAVVPVVVGLVAVLLGTRQTVLPVVAAVVAGVTLVTWASWRQGLLAVRRVVALAVGTAVVAVGGAVAGPVLAEGSPRFVLREHLVPPFDPRDHPSPLAGYRRFVKEWKDTELLTVRGLPDGVPVRLATMDLYDGVVWNVSGQGAPDGSGSFRRPGAPLAVPAAGAGRPVEVEVDVHALPGVWLPTVGQVVDLQAAGPDSADVRDELRVNDATGAAVLTGGLTDGLSYTLRAVVPPVPEDAELADVPAAAVSLPQPLAVPDVVPLVATELAATASGPVGTARTLEAGLVERGWFSHGLTDSGDHPSLSGHGADRMTSLLGGDLMVGDSEQYASAMALMARELGLPARVVLGFRPGAGERAEEDAAAGDTATGAAGEVTLTGDDAEAWVEIAFAGHGWVPFHPTPDESKTPSQDTPQDRADPQPQVVQSPPPAPEPVTPPEDDTEQVRTEDPGTDDGAASVWRRVALVAAVGAVPLLLVLGPPLLVSALRHRRRRRRRTRGDGVARVAGGWDEVLDAATDLAVPVPDGGTRRETAALLVAELGPASASPLTRLATQADAAVFAPGQPQPAEVDAYWDQVSRTVATMHAAVTRGQRLRARWSTASLRRRRSRPLRRRPSTAPASTTAHPSPRARASARRDGAS